MVAVGIGATRKVVFKCPLQVKNKTAFLVLLLCILVIARLAAADESKAYQLTVRRPRKHYSRCALSIGDRRSVKSCT